MSAALIQGNRREGERKEVDVGSQKGGGLLIESPRTPRGPRIPDLLGFRRRRRLLSGVFFPIFFSIFFL